MQKVDKQKLNSLVNINEFSITGLLLLITYIIMYHINIKIPGNLSIWTCLL